MTLLAMDRGIKNIFVPYENAYEASVAQGINVYGIKNVGELLSYLCGEKPLQKQPVYKPQEQDYESPDDFSDVKGQKVAKLALEIASAGRKGDGEKAAALCANDCIECGSCSYICPSGRFLVESIRLAKANAMAIKANRK